MKRNNKHNQRKHEITLMTLLANEATKEATDILSDYKIAKAKNHEDLEVKLAELYFAPKTDKLELEQKLANIHPHKNWLIRTLKLNTSDDIDKLKKELKDKKDDNKEEAKVKTKTSCYEQKCVDDNCLIHGKNIQTSNFSGNQNSTSETTEKKTFNSMEIIGLVGTIGLIGLTLVMVAKKS